MKVMVSRACVALFNAQWPCSPLSSDRHYWFEYDDNSADLIDCDVHEHSDGPTAAMLAYDCREFAFDGMQPEWAIAPALLELI